MKKNMYIASCDVDGGIYHYIIDENGKTEFKDVLKLECPMYMCFEEDKMHIVLRESFDNRNSGIVTYTVVDNGELINPTEVYDTGGAVGCHVSAIDGKIFCANYTSGSVCSLGKRVVIHTGETGPDKKRQEMAHAHQMCITPNKKFVCAVDLGLDAIIVYDLDLNEISRANVPAGYGARHCVFSKDGRKMFVVNELTSHISVFEFEPESGICRHIRSYDTRSDDGQKASAAIRISDDERFLYFSDRGDNAIVKFEIDGYELKNMKKFDCGGVFPRDFDIVPDAKIMVVTNEKSHDACIFKIDDNGDIAKIDALKNIKGALCVVFR